jgi:pimeloyl-ACP methyl ester carboxylesterase
MEVLWVFYGENMPTAKLADLDVYYEIHGNGSPLVLIAGYTCDHTFWDGLVPALAQRFKVIVFDNRGCGRSSDDGNPFSIETMARDAAGLISHLSLLKPIVVGQSMGGAIVQAMLARFADVCGPSVIINSTSVFSQVACRALDGLLALRRSKIDLDLLIDASLPWLFGSRWLSEQVNVRDFKRQLLENPVPQSLADQARQLAAIKSFDATGWQRHGAHPSLVISASEDVLTPPADGRRLAKRLDARFAEIAGGHASPTEQPEHLSRLLLQFLA